MMMMIGQFISTYFPGHSPREVHNRFISTNTEAIRQIDFPVIMLASNDHFAFSYIFEVRPNTTSPTALCCSASN